MPALRPGSVSWSTGTSTKSGSPRKCVTEPCAAIHASEAALTEATHPKLTAIVALVPEKHLIIGYKDVEPDE